MGEYDKSIANIVADIFCNPFRFVGSIEKVTEFTWIYNEHSRRMQKMQVTYSPALLQIYHEILVNAVENELSEKISVIICKTTNKIVVYNNGPGVDVTVMPSSNLYKPSVIFGSFGKTSKNQRTHSGYGAKLTNLYSKNFTVEIGSQAEKLLYKETWVNNMTSSEGATVTPYEGTDFTRITFTPDLTKFGMSELDENIVALMIRRAFDIAVGAKNVAVYVNEIEVHVQNIKEYVQMFIKYGEADKDKVQFFYELCNPNWEIACCFDPENSADCVSFVNHVVVPKNGNHVNIIYERINEMLKEELHEINTVGIPIIFENIKDKFRVFVKCVLNEPIFDSRMKHKMIIPLEELSQTLQLSKGFIHDIRKFLLTLLTRSYEIERTNLGPPTTLSDAVEAGGSRADMCTLFVVHGDTCAAFAKKASALFSSHYFGIYNHRIPFPNYDNICSKAIYDNKLLFDTCKALGLSPLKKYRTENEKSMLRYGKVLVITEKNEDGTHFKTLFTKFIYRFWPELLRSYYLDIFEPPLLKAIDQKPNTFYLWKDFIDWRNAYPASNLCVITTYTKLKDYSKSDLIDILSNLRKNSKSIVITSRNKLHCLDFAINVFDGK